jgi:hypothetical protein
MKKRIIITLTVLGFALFDFPLLYAEKVSVSGGIVSGVMPSMGGNLNSISQEINYGSATGIDGINREMDGFSTDNIDRLTGVYAGLEFKAVFFDYYLLRIGANYGMSVLGGKGKTVFYSTEPADLDYFTLKCEYSYTQYDFPVTIGVSIPIWKDARLSVSGGAAYARATYENKFTSDDTAASFERKGKFTGWGFPLVVLVQGDYYLNEKLALTSALAYYKGSSKVIRDSSNSDGDTDFACIDFSGYRFNLGVSYTFYSK